MTRQYLFLLAAQILLTLCLFLIDALMPLSAPYVLVVLLCLWFPARWPTLLTAWVCTLLMAIGLVVASRSSALDRFRVIDRSMGIVAVWFTAIVGLALRRTSELQAANRKLQQEFAERERLQSQLLRVQRLESLGVLASGIAHDLNNFLTPILMASNLLREERTPEERQQLLATLHASAVRGADMVRQILAFAGDTNSPRSLLEPRVVLLEIKAILEHTFPKTIQTTVEVADDLRPIHADPTQVAQALLNICVNARDAMPNGGRLSLQANNVSFTETTAHKPPDAGPGNYICIAVADTGTGVPAEVLEKLFDPFFTTKKTGTGLGLSVALGIARSHGGFIEVQTQLGSGSCFTLYLPVAEGALEVPAKPVFRLWPEVHGERTILVVDDEPAVLETLATALKGRGFGVSTACDGAEAVELFRRRHGQIQAVILDMMMPGMDGEAAMAALRDLDPGVRIIATSGLRLSESAARLLASNRGGFLPKPYTLEQLFDVLQGALDEPQPAEAPEQRKNRLHAIG